MLFDPQMGNEFVGQEFVGTIPPLQRDANQVTKTLFLMVTYIRIYILKEMIEIHYMHLLSDHLKNLKKVR